MKANPTHTIKSLHYMMSLVWKACPQKIIWHTITNTLLAVQSFFFNVLFIKFAIQALDGRQPMFRVVTIVVIALILKLGIVILTSYYLIRLKPYYDLKVSQYLQTMLFNKALSLDLLQYENKEFHTKYYKALANIESNAENIINDCIQVICNLVAVILVLVYIISIDRILLLMTIIPLTTTSVLKFSNKTRYKLNMEVLELKRKMDYMNHIPFLKKYSLELRMSNIKKCLKEYYIDASKEIQKKYKEYGRKLSVFRIITDFLLTTFTLFFSYIYVGWRYIIKKNLDISTLTVLVTAIMNLNGTVCTFIRYIYALQDDSLYICNIQDFMSETPQILKNITDKTKLSVNNFSIALKNVEFCYFGTDVNALQDINLCIKDREKIAIVGLNGSGKSTLIKVIMRLYDVTRGSVSYNERNIKEVNLENYRELFTPVFQDYKLFATTIQDNITLGNNQKNDIDYAMSCTGIKSKIDSFDKGILSQLTKEFDDKGVVLSQGQAQKLALTRAFITEAPIVILDEPTASLDAESEQLIYKNIYEKLVDKTVIFVSHRLTSTIMADRIIMMADGRISEVGNHEELMKKQGKYYQLYMIQANAYGGGKNE